MARIDERQNQRAKDRVIDRANAIMLTKRWNEIHDDESDRRKCVHINALMLCIPFLDVHLAMTIELRAQ